MSILLILGIPTIVASQTLPQSSSRFSVDERPQPVPVEQAFPYFVSTDNQGRLSITWQPREGHYLYRHKFAVFLHSPDSPNLRPVELQLPEGETKWDQFFGDIVAYYQKVTARLDIDRDALESGSLIIEFQGCAEWGFCYPPQRETYSLNP